MKYWLMNTVLSFLFLRIFSIPTVDKIFIVLQYVTVEGENKISSQGNFQTENMKCKNLVNKLVYNWK
jgi:hypothetical protein